MALGTASQPYDETAKHQPEPDAPPVSDEQIIKTLCKIIEHSEDYEFITTAWRAICQVRSMAGRPYSPPNRPPGQAERA